MTVLLTRNYIQSICCSELEYLYFNVYRSLFNSDLHSFFEDTDFSFFLFYIDNYL